MAFDGIFLRQICRRLQVLIGSRINKIYLISDTEVLFICHSNRKLQLMISCHSSYNRIHLTDRQYPTRNNPGNFIMLLRKYLEGGTIVSIEQAGLDRYLVIGVSSRNEIGDRISLQLYVELMGKYANLILVYNGRILEALKHIPPFENTKRTIYPSAVFRPTEHQEGKIDPFTITADPDYENLFEHFTGFSPLLSAEFRYRLAGGQHFTDIMREIDASESIYITPINNEEYFHCLPLTHLKKEPETMEICAGLDYLYYSKEERERIRQQTGDLFKFTRREIKKCETKIEKLTVSLEEAENCDIWHRYGDALYANPGKVVKGMKSVTLKDWEDNDLVIPLDPRLDARGNARKCFQKYRKGSVGQKYIREQLENCRENLGYFTLIQQQLEQADFDSAAEIRQELEQAGYLKARTRKTVKKPNKEPAFRTVHINRNTIYIGTNNIQNEYITFKKAGRTDTWFHIKDMHGPHVVINTEHPSEQEIRLCAQLAVYFSKARRSSSVPVNYTLIRNIKKIPHSKTGLVSMKEYQTIYIDVDEDYISSVLNGNQNSLSTSL